MPPALIMFFFKVKDILLILSATSNDEAAIVGVLPGATLWQRRTPDHVTNMERWIVSRTYSDVDMGTKRHGQEREVQE